MKLKNRETYATVIEIWLEMLGKAVVIDWDVPRTS